MATISISVNSFRATGLYPLNINKIPDCAYATAEVTSRSEAQIMDNVAVHLNNNHQPDSNDNPMPVQPEGVQRPCEIRTLEHRCFAEIIWVTHNILVLFVRSLLYCVSLL